MRKSMSYLASGSLALMIGCLEIPKNNRNQMSNAEIETEIFIFDIQRAGRTIRESLSMLQDTNVSVGTARGKYEEAIDILDKTSPRQKYLIEQSSFAFDYLLELRNKGHFDKIE